MAHALPELEERGQEWALKVTSLLYHDVVEHDHEDASGFRGGAAARYKLETAEFEAHLDALDAIGRPPASIADVLTGDLTTDRRWMLTFDDGGSSALRIGEALARRSWHGHFFVTVGRIGSPGFLSPDEIRAVSALGHTVGSHTVSHPERMSACTWNELLREWRDSAAVLAEIVGAPVSVASIPGGYYSKTVARAAAATGLEALFTSEPKAAARRVDGCLVLGRYILKSHSPARTARELASGAPPARVRQFVTWNGLKAAKTVAGPAYPWLRRLVLDKP